jgi:hypothetical protein
MKKSSGGFAPLLGLILLGAILVSGIWALGSFIDTLFLVIGGYRTQGEVTYVTDIKDPFGAKYGYMVTLTDDEGQLVRARLSGDTATIQYPVGSQLQVIYREGSRRTATILKIDNFWSIWGSTIIISSIALVVFIITYIFVKFGNSDRKTKGKGRKPS